MLSEKKTHFHVNMKHAASNVAQSEEQIFNYTGQITLSFSHKAEM
jgi:hypothetical protein